MNTRWGKIPFSKIYIPLLFLSVLGLFAHTIPYPMVYDDLWTIQYNESINKVQPMARFFSDPSTVSANINTSKKDIYRPLPTLSFALNKFLFGENPQSFRMINILIHFLNGLLLVFILKRKTSLKAATFGTLLFLLHPIQVESVVWLTQRSILMCTFFILLGYSLWDQSNEKKSLVWLVPFSFVLALFCKETALGLIPLLLLGIPPLFKKFPPRMEPKKIPKELSKHIVWVLSAGIGFGYLALRKSLLGIWSQPQAQGESLAVSLGEGIHALGLYGKNIFLPFDLNVSYSFPEKIQASSGYFWLGLVLLMILIGGAIFFRKKKPILTLGLVFFLCFWIIHSGFVPLTTYAADRFLYLPLVGLSLVGAGIYEKVNKRKYIFGLVLITLFTFSSLRSWDWRSEKHLWASSLKQNPENAFAQASFAQTWVGEGQWDIAYEQFELALSKKPTVLLAKVVLKNLILLSEKRNDPQAAQHWQDLLDRTEN